MPELLSPCGGADSIEAAVRSGADAVYLGIGSFNARCGAKNFLPEELEKAAEYCRINGVKLYIAMNTLISDSELPEALETARAAARAGADAFIVQDLGLAAALRKSLPDIPLHASTQMSIHSEYGLELLSSLGFTRVVAAREMSKAALKRLCERAASIGMEVEVFVHGALCMCVSGQCLMSSVIGGRSGNRGRCAQPCRLPFKTVDGSEYSLSLKDLSLIPRLDELAELGVDSFKIEGRMKRPEYVAAATSACRAAMDTGAVPDDLNTLLASVFSRSGFTDGYYTEKIGSTMFGRRLEADSELSASVLGKIHELYRRERSSVPVKISFKVTGGAPSELTLSNESNAVTVLGPIPEKASSDKAATAMVAKLEKLGGTPYFAESISCDIEARLYVSAAAIGEMRREAAALLSQRRAQLSHIRVCGFTPTTAQGRSAGPVKYIARFSSPEQIPDDLGGIAALALPIERIEDSLEIDLPLLAELPRGVMGNEGLILSRLSALKGRISAAVCGNLCAAELCLKAGVPFVTDSFFNIFNSEAAATALSLGAVGYTASLECSAEAIRKLPSEKAILAYGRIPLMLTRNCPGRAAAGCADCHGDREGVDRLGNRFPYSCRLGFTEIYNNRPVYVLDRINEFSTDYALLYFTLEDKNECRRIIEAAVHGLPPVGEYTRGLYYRRVY